MKPALWIRADASTAVGTGHVMRCLSVAEAVGDHARLTLLTHELPPALARRAQNLGVTVQDLAPLPEGVAVDEAALNALTAALPEMVLADSYQISGSWLTEVSRLGIALALFDDLNDRGELAVDLVINPSPASLGWRYMAPKGFRQERLLGPEYAPLRPEFAQWRKRYAGPNAVQNCLINLGGSDPLQLTAALAQRALQLPDSAIIHAVTGAACQSVDTIAILAAGEPRLNHHHDVLSMAPLMAASRLAIAAPGGTLFELACVGVPLIAVQTADNQAPALNWFAEHGGLVAFDGHRLDMDVLARELLELWHDEQRLTAMSATLRAQVDGEGVRRIAHALIKRMA